MRRIIRLFTLIAAMATFFCATAQGQGDEKGMSREQLAEAQARSIAGDLAMDDATSRRFVETFCQFQREMWALGPRPRKHKVSATEDEAAQAIKERFAHSQKILDLRKKYYEIYSGFLSQKQIEQVYEREGDMMGRLAGRDGRPDHKRRPNKK